MVEIDVKSLWRKAVQFHGHCCPGITIGVVACQVVLEEFGADAANDDLVAVVENDACGVDAIQVLLGCTLGNGKLIHRDYGKSVYTFLNRKTGRAIRLSMRSDAIRSEPKADERLQMLSEKVGKGDATDFELEEFRKHRQTQIANLLKSGRDIFAIQDIDISIPQRKVAVGRSINCESCKEPTLVHRIKQLNGMKLCIPCYEKLTT